MLRIYSISILLVLATMAGCRNNTDSNPSAGVQASSGDAIDSLKAQLFSAPSADSTRERLVLMLLQKKAFPDAILHADTLLMHQPGNPAYLFMKADALEQKGDTTNAILQFRSAFDAAGSFPDAALRLANLYAETGNAEALRLCDELLNTETALAMRSQVLFVKGIYFIETKQTNKALAIFNNIIREDHVFMDAYIEKGLIFYDQGKYEDAHKVFTLSTEVSNAFADGYFWMAKCETKMGRTANAIQHFKSALALDPSITEAREALQALEKK